MGKNKSSKQQLAIAALLQNPNIAEAAQQAGIGHRTLRRWLSENPDFRAAYAAAQKAVVQSAISLLRQSSAEAIKVLRAIMGDADSAAGTRVNAARTILELTFKTVEIEEINEQLVELKAQLACLEKAIEEAGNENQRRN